jgi:hypothetical protein
MNQAIGDILPFALVVGLSPIPIIAEVLLLFSAKPKPNGAAFAVGFVVGLTAVAVVMLLVAGTQDLADPDSTASSGSATLRIVLGLLLVGAGIRRLRNRPKPGEGDELPKWMAGIETFEPAKAFTVGLAAGGINPKNLAMSFAAVLSIAAVGLPSSEEAVALAVYVAIGSIGVIAPLVAAIALGDRSEAILDDWKAWLAANSATVMAVVFIVLGVMVFGKGLAAS